MSRYIYLDYTVKNQDERKIVEDLFQKIFVNRRWATENFTKEQKTKKYTTL